MAKPNFILPNKPAIKAGSILSYNYTDDLKFAAEPLDFSRNSSATRVNEQGLIEEVGYFGPQLVQNGDFSQEGSELIINGDFATDSNWIKGTGWSISGGIATLDGTQVGSSGLGSSTMSVTSGKTYKVVVNVISKSSGFRLYDNNGVVAYGLNVGENVFYRTVTSSTYQVTPLGLSGATGSIDNVSVKEVGQNWVLGSGWSIGDNKAVCDGSDGVNMFQNGVIENLKKYKISFSILNYVSGFLNGRIGSANSNDFTVSSDGNYSFNITSDGTNLIFRSSSFNGSITNISVIEIIGDKPRIDYSDSSTEPSLLLEPQSTNLLPYSSDLTSWTKIVSSVSYLENVINPSGETFASKITQTSSGGYVQLSRTFTGVETFSAFVKKSSSDFVRFYAGGNSVYFNILNGTIETISGSVEDKSITDFGNGWFRISITVNSTSSSSVRIYPASSGSSTSGLNSLFVYGTQLEVLSYATSYIPTSGSTATRLGESANNAGGAGVFNSEEGVLYAEIAALADDGTYRQILLHDNAYNNRIALRYMPSSNEINVYLINGTVQVTLYYNLSNALDFNKLAFKYKENDFALWVNGIEVGTDTSGTTFSANTLQKIDFDFTNNYFFYGKTKNLQVFNHALTDEELQTLTT